jgi:signal transduction histidine kinase
MDRGGRTVIRPRRSLRRRIRLALALMVLPLTLAGAAGALFLTEAVDGFREVTKEQTSELSPLAPLEARLREVENAGYDAFHTDRRDELDVVVPAVEAMLPMLVAAMDEQEEIDTVRAAGSAFRAALSELQARLREPFPARAEDVEGDPLAAFAAHLDDAVANVRTTQRLALSETAVEVAAAERLQQRLAVLLLLLLLLSVAIALLLARHLGRHLLDPLRRLEHASGEVGAGRYDHRVGLDRDDELGAVGSAFDTMVERIQHAREELRLSQERLHESQKLDAVGQLAGGIAHDFNNLLLVVQGYTTLVADELGEDDPRRADLAEAQAAAERAAALTKQLLTFSRREVTAPATVDVNDALRRLESMVRRLIRTNIALELELDPAAGATRIDPVQLEQVVLNLVLNARDAIAAGGRIAISSAQVDVDETLSRQHPELEPGRYVVIGVRDDGEGMSREVAERIFEPFFTTKPRGTGTGLGLAVTHGIVREAGGSVSVYSEPGLGALFSVYLPVADAEAAAPAAAPEAVPDRLPPATVLVAEDEPAIRRLIERVLADAGAKPVLAASAEEAVEAARRLDGRFDLLVSDLVMPGQSGFELADTLARTYGAAPVVFISGYSDAGTARPDGVAYLQKPFTRDALLRAVADQLAA